MNLQDNKELRKYNCTQQELYAIGTIGWGSCQQYQPDFSALKPKYTVVYIDGKLSTIETVRKMPDEDARAAYVKNKKQALQAKAAACLVKWQGLKRYISDAFSTPEDFETNVQEAGQGKYADASNEDWEQVYGLMESGKNYITAHTAALEANDNMPATFAAEFDTATTEFDVAYKAFKKMEEDVEVMASDKVKANNLLFDDLMEMFADGQHIYRYDAAKRERFVFDRVKELVSSQQGSGNALTMSGVITDEATDEPIANAQFTVGPHTFTSDANGYFSKTITISEPTTYNVTITAPGFVDINETHEFTPGEDIEYNVEMDAKVGSISGSATDAGTGNGVANASIVISGNGINIMVNTDANGNFNSNGVRVGTYTVTVNAPGYVGQSVGVTISENVNTIQDFSLVVVP